MKNVVWIQPMLGVVLAGLWLAGCVSEPPPPRHPGPYKDPVDAFNAVNAPHPYTGPEGASSDQLGTDIRHLGDARSAYEHDQEMQAAQRRREQVRCRQQTGSHQVRIQDGTDDPNATYCQRGADRGRDGDNGS